MYDPYTKEKIWSYIYDILIIQNAACAAMYKEKSLKRGSLWLTMEVVNLRKFSLIWDAPILEFRLFKRAIPLTSFYIHLIFSLWRAI